MAFTKITAAGIGSTETVTLDGLSVINNGSFGGNLTVSGVLTYEDVTNVDSVGVITARAGVLVGSGITLSKDGDIFATGISTFSEGIAGDLLIDDKIVHRGDTNTAIRFSAADTVTVETGGSERFRVQDDKVMVSVDFKPDTDSARDLGTNSNRFANGYFDTLYGDGSNLSNVISGVDVKFEGASVGTGVTMLNFVGFNTVTPPASGLSTITSGQNLTIGVRSGSAVEASLTGTSFNVIARSGGNISINI